MKKRLNSGMISMTLFGPREEKLESFDSNNAVVVTFKHVRQAKGPSYENIRHTLYPGEEPTAIKDTARCVFWNESKGYFFTLKSLFMRIMVAEII